MSELAGNIDNEGYCKNCLDNTNCFNCSVMDLLIESRVKILNIVDKNCILNAICPGCGNSMKKKNKKSKSEQFWCPSCSSK